MKNLKTNSGILLVGIGNSGRGDDGLGWRFLDMTDSLGYDFLDLEYRYQLQVEDAELISGYDVVVFVDASHEKLGKGFGIMPCIAASHAFFSTHAQAPAAILHLANHLYNKFPKAYVLAISGEEWDLQTSLSTEAEKNLQAAIDFFMEQFLPIQPEMVISW
jgi:hydrogenase maturation protease